MLYPDDEGDIDRNLNLGLDIIAVHGLNGDCFKTWTNTKSKKFWLRDFLPQDLPRARVMTFGYDAAVAFSNSVSGIEDHARDLLRCLVEKRKDSNIIKRPLIFVGHSLGGLVIKQTLVIASQEAPFSHVINSTRGVIFFGTPHQGSGLANYASTLTRVPSSLALKPPPALLNSLKNKSLSLANLTDDFKKLAIFQNISIVSFYETRTMTILSKLVVEKKSALLTPLGIKPTYENQIPVNADHRQMCRFTTPQDVTYKTFVQSIRQILKSNKEVENRHYIVPHVVNPDFTGRYDIRQRLSDTLVTDRHMKPIGQQRFVLYGMRGAGKTQICLKFAQDHRDQFWGIFWIDASSVETAQEGFLAIARECKQEENVDSIKVWLSGKEDWLLILDNADDPSLDITKFFPVGNRGTILITTWNVECRQNATAGSYQVNELDINDATTLLLKSALLEDMKDKTMRKSAENTVQTLGCLALAIIQAGAVIRQNLCSLDGFCGLYVERKKELLECGRPKNIDYQQSVYTTWEISIRRLEHMSQTESRDDATMALELLRLFAFMHFDGIREDFFQLARINDVDFRPEENIFEESLLVKMMPAGWDQLLMSKALRLLISFSLVTVDSARHISMHPLVHNWSRERMSTEQRQEAWLTAAATLSMSCRFTSTDADITHRRVVFPHIDACLASHNGQLFENGCDPERLFMALKFGLAYYEASRYEKSLDLELPVLELLPPGHPQRLVIMSHIGLNLYDLNRWQEAIEIQNTLLMEADAREDHELSLGAMVALGANYSGLWQHEKAIQACSEALARFQESFGGEHYQILNAQSIISRSYVEMGRSKEAVTLSEKIFSVQLRLRGEYHLHTLMSMENLAVAYESLGHFEKARLLQEKTVTLMKESLGPSHRRTVLAQTYLADYRTGKHTLWRRKAGIKYKKEVLKQLQITYGEKDLRTLRCMSRLAKDLFVCGSLEEAESLLETVAEEMVSSFGPDHEFTVEILEDLTRTRNLKSVRKALHWWVPKQLTK